MYINEIPLELLIEALEKPLGLNPYADANGTEPLLPAGDYEVAVSFLESEPANRWKKCQLKHGRRVVKCEGADILIEITQGSSQSPRTTACHYSVIPRQRIGSTEAAQRARTGGSSLPSSK